MTSWLKRTQAGIQSAPTTPAVSAAPVSAFAPSHAGRVLDPNAPDARLDIEARCIYERRLPGEAYITAHVTRLQDGFYDTPSTHGDCIDNVRFLAVSLVFHPAETGNRFQAATVTIGLHDDTDQAFTDPTPGHKPLKEPRSKPKFLRYAPHVLFGGVSPETLDWNFNLTGSLGVSQTPASASISPSGGVSGSYKLYQMMRIQGSTRTLLAQHHHEYDIEDGEVCWTMEENVLQRSGLPREMTFVMMITKGDVENVVCDIDIKPRIASWFGHYPGWWNNALRYRPLPKEHVDLDMEMGQKFEPVVAGRGFNFANLAGTFNDFVSLPGTTYSLTDAFANQAAAPDAQNGQDSSNKSAKPSSGQKAPQSQHSQPATSTQPPPRSQTVPPPSEMASSEAPMDYHIYLHNPRTINLHATPPPQPSSSPPVISSAMGQTESEKYNYQPTVNIIRPKSAAPAPPASSISQQRVPSPANTKMKRRSIDITNIKNSPYYDEAKTPMRNPSGQSSSGGSLRRRGSKTDLRYSSVAEEKSRSVSSEGSDSNSRSSRLSLVRSLSNPASVKSVIEAPSPPDPGLSGFKARLKAHMASEREREREHGRSRTQARPRNTDRLPFEVQPESYRPPRDITPSPDPTDNPNSETTQESLVDDGRVDSSGSFTKPTAGVTNLNPNPHLLDVTTNTPTRRERLIVTSPPPPQSQTPLSRSHTSPGPRRSPASYRLSPEPSKSALPNGTHPPVRSPKPTSPPTASLSGFPIPRILSPYTASKWDGFRANSTANTSPPTARPRRGSSVSLSPDQSEIGLAVDADREVAVEDEPDAQPSAGDLREEARRRARQRSLKRLSMPVGASSSFGSGEEKTGFGRDGEVAGGKENISRSMMEDQGYEYITAAEADGDWEDR